MIVGIEMPDIPCDSEMEICSLTDTTPVYGTLQLIKLKFETVYNVCSDTVEDFSDFKNFYILDGDGSVEYHWLADRKDPDDKKKPANLPVTVDSNNKIKCTAYFKVEDGKVLRGTPSVKIDDQSRLKFQFDKKRGNTSGEFHLTFTAQNLPYKNTVNYVEYFTLNFTYSVDGEKTWLNAGSSMNELYITWKKFDISLLYENGSGETETMRLKSNKTGGKFYILESLLYIGCKNAMDKGKNEEDILDAIFFDFEDCKVSRKKETFSLGMGYWRNNSAPLGTMAFRGLRCLLKNGEARCGEWTSFFNHLAFTQGITQMGEVPIATSGPNPYTTSHIAAASKIDPSLGNKGYNLQLLLVKNCSMEPQIDSVTKKPTNIIENKKLSKAQGNDDAVNIFGDHVFSRHENSKRFYDASYGIGKLHFRNKAASTMDNYCNNMLDGLFFAKYGGKYTLYIRHYAKDFWTGMKYKIVIPNAYVYLNVNRSDVV